MNSTKPRAARDSRIDKYHSFLMDGAVFSILFLAVLVPSGYSLGAVVLFFIGLLQLPSVIRGRTVFNRELLLWAVTIATMMFLWAVHITDPSGQLIMGSLGLERCLKYLLMIIVVVAMLGGRPHFATLRWGCALGAGAAGILALWQMTQLGLGRAYGHTNAIKFGDISLLLGICSAVWALQRGSLGVRLIGWGGAMLGLMASLASGSRGGWLVLPILLPLALWLGSHATPPVVQRVKWYRSRGLWAIVATIMLCLSITTVPSVQKRLQRAAQELSQPSGVSNNTSIGVRKALWWQAWKVGTVSPWMGVGQSGYDFLQREAISAKRMPKNASSHDHAHNELLDMLAKRGLVGVLGLMMFYLIPGWISIRLWRRQTALPEATAGEIDFSRASALCGLITVLAFFGFGLTDVMFGKSMGNMVYLLLVTIWIAAASLGPVHRSGAGRHEAA